jgi:hypothetical protein
VYSLYKLRGVGGRGGVRVGWGGVTRIKSSMTIE